MKTLARSKELVGQILLSILYLRAIRIPNTGWDEEEERSSF